MSIKERQPESPEGFAKNTHVRDAVEEERAWGLAASPGDPHREDPPEGHIHTSIRMHPRLGALLGVRLLLLQKEEGGRD